MITALEVLNRLEAQGVIGRYALGGAMAALYYAEPVVTYDMDVFMMLPRQGSAGLITLTPLYDALKAMGYSEQAEHVMIENVPVQFLPAYNALLEEALEESNEVRMHDVPTRVLKAEHLIAIAIQTDRRKDHARVQMLLDEADIDMSLLRDILERHNLPCPTALTNSQKWTHP